MALRFCDSFDHYGLGSTNILKKWTSFHNLGHQPQIVSGGRCNTRCMEFEQNDGVTKGLAPVGYEGYCGFGLKYSIVGDIDWDPPLFGVEGQNGYPLGDWDTHFHVYFQADNGSIYVQRGGIDAPPFPPVQHVHTAGGILTEGVWQFVEFGWLIDSTVGWLKCYVNGVEIFDVNGIDTRGITCTGPGTFDYMELDWIAVKLAGGSGIKVWIDDLYVNDADGAVSNTFNGDSRVQAIYPTALGASAQFTPSAGANWAAVDDTLDLIVAEPDITDYVESQTAHHEDTHVHSDIDIPAGTVFGIQHCLYAQNLDTGGRRIAGVVRQAGTSYPGTDLAPSMLSSRYLLDPRSVNPATAAAFDVAEINGDEYGYELTV